MALKFSCPKCGQEMVVIYLKISESAKCQYCGTEVVVPSNAVTTEEQPTIDKIKDIKPTQPVVEVPVEISPEEQERIVREFKKKRNISIVIFAGLFLLFIATMIISMLRHKMDYTVAIWLIIVWLGMLLDLIIFSCPKCKESLWFMFKPKYCFRCGHRNINIFRCSSCGESFIRKRFHWGIHHCWHCGVRLRRNP